MVGLLLLLAQPEAAPSYAALAAAEDVLSLPQSVRKRVRYFRLDGASDEQRGKWAALLAGHVNHLSRGKRIVRPVEVPEGRGMVYRIDLDDYKWSAKTWEGLPHGKYANARDDSEPLRVLRDRTGSRIPLVDGRWFIYRSGIVQGRGDTGYYAWLGVRGRESFADLIGLDRQSTNANLVVRKSGVSGKGRKILPLRGRGGRAWMTWESVNVNSLVLGWNDPNVDSEWIGKLPNGLPTFAHLKRSGTLLATTRNLDGKPPRSDQTTHVGRSCIACHYLEGGFQEIEASNGRGDFGIAADRESIVAPLKAASGVGPAKYARLLRTLWAEFENETGIPDKRMDDGPLPPDADQPERPDPDKGVVIVLVPDGAKIEVDGHDMGPGGDRRVLWSPTINTQGDAFYDIRATYGDQTHGRRAIFRRGQTVTVDLRHLFDEGERP